MAAIFCPRGDEVSAAVRYKGLLKVAQQSALQARSQHQRFCTGMRATVFEAMSHVLIIFTLPMKFEDAGTIRKLFWMAVDILCGMLHTSLTHWGRVTYICVSKLTIIGSDYSLSPGRRQAIIWTNAGILLIRHLGTNFNEMLIELLILSLIKMRLKVSSAKWLLFCLGLNVLIAFLRSGLSYTSTPTKTDATAIQLPEKHMVSTWHILKQTKLKACKYLRWLRDFLCMRMSLLKSVTYL